MAEETYDIIIVGGGPAGVTAGIYTARHGLRTLILEQNKLGGRAADAHWIDNFPGFPEGISGPDLMERFIAQAERFHVEFRREAAVGLSVLGDLKMVLTRKGVYQANAVVVSTGIQRRQLKVPGEMEYKGRGVSYCALCDGPLFSGKVVAVIGAGKEAVDEALTLTHFAEKVYAIPGSRGWSAEPEELKELLENPKVAVVEGAEVDAILGEEQLTHLKLTGASPELLEVDGVFVGLERVDSVDMLREAGIATDDSGCVRVDERLQTNLEGVFAAGDCVCSSSGMQVVTAAGEGGRAGISVIRYLRALRRRAAARGAGSTH